MVCFFSASLPTLEFGKPSPITVAEFDSMAREYLDEKKCACLAELNFPVPENDPEKFVSVHRIWSDMRSFERVLRLRIAAIRAEKLEVAETVAEPEEFFSEIEYILNSAAICDDPCERELMIDRVRWAYLENMEMGHMLDFDGLCIYRLKLQILEAYRGRTPEEGVPHFERALEMILSASWRVPKRKDRLLQVRR